MQKRGRSLFCPRLFLVALILRPVHYMHSRCLRSFCLRLMDLHSISIRAKRVPLGLSAVPPIPEGKFSLLQINLHSLPFPCVDALNHLLQNCYKWHFTVPMCQKFDKKIKILLRGWLFLSQIHKW